MEVELDRLVPWPLRAASRARIAGLWADGDLDRAELARLVETVRRYEAQGTLAGPPAAVFVRLVQGKLRDHGQAHLWRRRPR